jgi:hypothetical protein
MLTYKEKGYSKTWSSKLALCSSQALLLYSLFFYSTVHCHHSTLKAETLKAPSKPWEALQ